MLATWKHWICSGLQPLKRSGLVVLYIYIIVKFCLCHSGVSGCTATDNPCYSKFLLECDKRVVDQDGMTISHVFRLSPWHKCRKHKVINWPTDSILSVEHDILSLSPYSQVLLMLTCQRQVPMKQEVGSIGRLLGPKDLLSHAESGDEKSICIASTKILFDSGSLRCKFM